MPPAGLAENWACFKTMKHYPRLDAQEPGWIPARIKTSGLNKPAGD
jgi:hypothetical protein